MAKYQQYEEYKDSGIEWLGEIPKGWDVSKLKYYSSIQGGYAFSSEDFTEDGVQILRIGNVYQNRLALERQPTFVPETMLKDLPDFIVKDGDILMSLTGTLGKRDYGFAVGIKDEGKYLLNQRVAKLNPIDENIDRDFLLNVLWSSSYLNQLYSLPSGTKQANLSNSDVLDILIAVPSSKHDQTQIANFLDFETAQIDTLIDKQQTLIQLLKEKRQAVISHAVTKGLNPDAPMKDSGVEWLGDVPEHWEVKRIKHYGRIIGGFAFKSDDFIDSGYPVLKISNVSHLQLNFDDESFLPPSFVERHLEYKVEENDLVFAMTRPIISGGIKIAKIPKLEAMPLVNQRVGFLKLKSELLADFILYSSLSSSFKAQFKNNMTITNQPNISSEGIESVALPMPPKNELVEIVDFLNNSETVFQNLSIKSEQQVELLKERRTALISAAVTGKIDVRGWRAPE